jgi:hypothetical protein
MRDLSWNQKEPIEELIEACRYRNPKVAPGLCNAAAAQLKLFKELQVLAGEELLELLESEKRDKEVLEALRGLRAAVERCSLCAAGPLVDALMAKIGGTH